ncbi:MAG: tRNA preQ1(34) S-adenosylmethionine ribosyltransferase-isomerase QueA [Rhodospirillales bacterium]
MRTDAFDFDLPRHLIAERPASPRDAARMLAVRDRLEDRVVRDLPAYLRAGDALVVNDTRVIPARLRGRRGAAAVEVTLHRATGPAEWRAFARPAKRLRPGDQIEFGDGFAATVEAHHGAGEVGLRFASPEALAAGLARYGETPLPPYIPRSAGADARDAADYQTVYARHDGAVAAPTAGLHFTDALLEAIRAMGVRVVTVTLHVGAGTFLPVKVENVADHRMHAEAGVVSAAAAAALNAARADGGRLVVVGTTVLRILEAAARDDRSIAPFAGETRLFITPGYRFRTADVLMTNFHLPKSTLFMLVSAFAGLARMKAAYAHAVREGYRFYSYGDSTLLFPDGAP